MSQFAGDDTMSILDSINDGKHVVPKNPDDILPTTTKRKLLIAVIAVAAVAVFGLAIYLTSIL
jgi:hypothetical protein